MEAETIIIIIVFILFGILWLYAYTGAVLGENIKDMVGSALFFVTVFVLTGMLLGYGIWRENKPQAIDVYQGKTTLEITYRNGVAIDSVVIFK